MNRLYPEDFDTFQKLGTYEGPSYQMSALVAGVLKGMLSEIVRVVSQNCEVITKDGWDYSDTGYEFRNGFECASWLENASRQEILFGPEINVRHEVGAAIEGVLANPENETGKRLVLAWYWHDLEHDKDQKKMLVTELTSDEVSKCIEPLLRECIEDQMAATSKFVDAQIEAKSEEAERSRKEKFEYDDDDYYLLIALEELHDSHPDDEVIAKALKFADRFMSKELTDEDESFEVTIIYRNNGESQYVSFELSPESMAISTGGYAQSDAGGDSYSNEVWRLDAYEHAKGYCDVVPEALELLNLGAEIEE